MSRTDFEAEGEKKVRVCWGRRKLSSFEHGAIIILNPGMNTATSQSAHLLVTHWGGQLSLFLQPSKQLLSPVLLSSCTFSGICPLSNISTDSTATSFPANSRRDPWSELLLDPLFILSPYYLWHQLLASQFWLFPTLKPSMAPTFFGWMANSKLNPNSNKSTVKWDITIIREIWIWTGYRKILRDSCWFW